MGLPVAVERIELKLWAEGAAIKKENGGSGRLGLSADASNVGMSWTGVFVAQVRQIPSKIGLG